MLKLKVIETNPEYNNPALITFPQNLPSLKFLKYDDNQDNEQDVINFELYKHKDIKNKYILHGSNDKFDWLASNNGRNFSKTQSSKYVIGIHMKDNDEIQMLEVDQIFNLKQSFKDIRDNNEDNEAEKSNIFSAKKAMEQKQILIDELGNKKSKKILKTLKNSIVREANISHADEIKDILNEKAESIKKKSIENPDDPLTLTISSKKELLPDFSLDATTPEKVYDIHSIITTDEWENINIEEIKKHTKKSGLLEKDKRYYTKYVYDELLQYSQGNKNPKNEQDLNYKLKCLLYLNMLFKFLGIHNIYKTIPELSSEMKMPLKCIKSVLDKFYIINLKEGDMVKYLRNSMLIDKLICHILVLALIINDYDMNGSILATAMKIDQKKFAKYCEEIGATIRKRRGEDAGGIWVQLNAPLRFKAIEGKTRGKRNRNQEGAQA